MKDSPSQDNPTDDISILENEIQRLTDLIKKNLQLRNITINEEFFMASSIIRWRPSRTLVK